MKQIHSSSKQIVTALSCTLMLMACAAPPAPPIAQSNAQAQLANPASQNCIAKGGTLTTEQDGSGGEFGVCTFDDNRQCEEWAMFQGECPEGGLKVTGYITSAGRFCAITGGEYKVTSAGDATTEQGTCTFKTGKICDAAAYFDGTCRKTD